MLNGAKDSTSRNYLSTYWIPNQIWFNREVDYKIYKRSRVLVSFLMIGLITFLLYGAVNIAKEQYLSSVLCFIVLSIFSGFLISFKLSATYRLSSYGMLITLLSILFLHQLRSEPFMISHTVWVPIFPVLGAMLLGVRGTVCICVFTLLTFVGAPLIVEYYGPFEIVRTNDMTLNLFAIFASLGVSFFVVFMYEQSKWEVFSLLEKKNAELEKISEDNRLLTAIVTHDLSNPLTAMGFYMEKIEHLLINELGENHTITQKALEKSSKFHKGFATSCEIVNSVKHMLALQMKKIEISLSATDLFDSLKKVVHDFDHLAHAKKITIKINRLKEDRFHCLAEPISLRASVLSNLISNAIKFSQEGSVIDINLSRELDLVILEIRDYGVGIGPDKISNLFELKKASSTLGTFGEKGTGYGLPIVKAYIDRFHGKIEILSMNQSIPKTDGTLVRVSLQSAA